MTEHLQEFFDSRGQSVRVDRGSGALRGVKLLGLRSRNGREYDPAALARAASLYEGAKVNVNHPKGHPLSPRDYQDRIGVIRNVQLRAGEGLFGDFHYNPKHSLAEQLAWDAEFAPENVGFSHNVHARTTRRGEQLVVEEIVQVQSVDLVADPATTRGLFESCAASDPALPEASDREAGAELERLREEVERLRLEVDRWRSLDFLRARRALIAQALSEHGLPAPPAAGGSVHPLIGEALLQSLLAAPDEAAVRTLVAERAALVAQAQRGTAIHERVDGGTRAWLSGRPMSREQSLVAERDAAATAADFAAAIR